MLKSVKVPEPLTELFSQAEQEVENYFKNIDRSPENGSILINDERYILVRASSMSIHFLEFIKNMYPGLSEADSIEASSKVLFEMAKSIGVSDAKHFHKKQNLQDPLDKLSTGPNHFAHTGWANVHILPESTPSSDENFKIVYDHPNTFEADSWIKKGEKTNFCTCFMNAGYSSGWCQESFSLELVAQEITCRAKGDPQCRFIMAQPHKVNLFIKQYKERSLDKNE